MRVSKETYEELKDELCVNGETPEDYGYHVDNSLTYSDDLNRLGEHGDYYEDY